MNQLKRFKILEACNYLLENLSSTQTDEVRKIWMQLRYTEDESLKLPDFKKCSTCGGLIPISDFIIYKNKGIIKEESKDCSHCRDYNNAIKGIVQSLRYDEEIDKMFGKHTLNWDKARCRAQKKDEFLKNFANTIPQELIEIKILIIKLQKKLYNYDAS